MASDVKPVWPSCEGEQYDQESKYLKVRYDSAGNEIASDEPMHANATPGEGESNYGGPQYSNDFRSYGVAVNPPAVGGSNQSVDVASNRPGKA